MHFKKSNIFWHGTKQDAFFLFLETSVDLKYVHLPLVTNAKCVNASGSENLYPEEEITKNMVCAGFLEGGKGGCKGDSGGPLVVPRSSTDDTAIVYGITSFMNKCAQPKYPTVFARVTEFLPWIKTFLE